MKLEKLTIDNVKILLEKPVYCFEKTVSYLDELVQKYSNIEIQAIFDDFKRNQGTFLFYDKEIRVYGFDAMGTIDWSHNNILITSDYFQEAFETIKNMQINIDCVYYFANQETEYELSYREKYKSTKLQDIIIFRSGPHASSYVKGMDFADNARALFEYMLTKQMNENYRLVWFVKDPKQFEEYAKIKNVEFVAYDWSMSAIEEERDKYYNALCLAKYIFFTDAYGIARNCREDQVRVQLWHGCGFKSRVNFSRCEKRYDYKTVTSDLYAQVHAKVYGLRADQMLVTGIAKGDWIFHPISKERLSVLNFPKAAKYIFWLPTFRSTDKKLEQLNEYNMESEVGLPIIESFERLNELNQLLIKKNIGLIVKLHPFQKKETIKCNGYSNICMIDNGLLTDEDIQINQILWYADALISDYSSVAVDYLALNRPIAFTLDDFEKLQSSRGFILDNTKEMLPGKEIYCYEDFVSFICDISEGIDTHKEKRNKLRTIMNTFSDDKNCERICRALKIL